MNKQIGNALRTGLVFGIVTTFLFLIGFTGTAAQIIGRTLQDTSLQLIPGLTSLMFNMLLFLALVGMWAGAQASRRPAGETSSLGQSLLSGAIAGLVHGLIVGLLAYLVGTLNAAHVQMSYYLSQLLPDVIQLFLLGKSPVEGALWHFGLLLASGAAGAVIAFYVRKPAWRDTLRARWNALRERFVSQPKVRQMRANAAFRPVTNTLLVILLFALPLVVGQYWNYTLGTVGIYVLLGLGLNIVVGLAGLLDLGYVAFFAIGA